MIRSWLMAELSIISAFYNLSIISRSIIWIWFYRSCLMAELLPSIILSMIDLYRVWELLSMRSIESIYICISSILDMIDGWALARYIRYVIYHHVIHHISYVSSYVSYLLYIIICIIYGWALARSMINDIVYDRYSVYDRMAER